MTPGELALRFTAANDEWRRLRTLRASFVCEYEFPRTADPDEGGRIILDMRGDDPCWKWYYGETDTYENGQSFQSAAPGYARDEGDWCPSCVERGKVNAAVRVAGKRRNALLGALLRASRKVLHAP